MRELWHRFPLVCAVALIAASAWWSSAWLSVRQASHPELGATLHRVPRGYLRFENEQVVDQRGGLDNEATEVQVQADRPGTVLVQVTDADAQHGVAARVLLEPLSPADAPRRIGARDTHVASTDETGGVDFSGTGIRCHVNLPQKM